MGHILKLVALGVVAVIVYVAITALLDKQSYELEKSCYGCGEAVKYPHQEPIFGLDLLLKDIKEHKACIYLKEVQRQYAVYGKRTKSAFSVNA
jgi:hypothetical protein